MQANRYAWLLFTMCDQMSWQTYGGMMAARDDWMSVDLYAASGAFRLTISLTR